MSKQHIADNSKSHDKLISELQTWITDEIAKAKALGTTPGLTNHMDAKVVTLVEVQAKFDELFGK